jgi:hypothetical protein
MTLIALRAAVIAAFAAAGVTTGAVAQTTADPHHPDTTLAQATPSPESGDMAGQGQGAQPGQPGMMPPGMMCRGMMSGMPMMGKTVCPL